MATPDIWRILSEAAAGRRVALLALVDCQGSAPNGPGARMLVFEDGSAMGTIGGGKSEALLQCRAAKMLAAAIPPPPEAIHLSHGGRDQAGDSGMICSGAQSYVLLVPTSEDLEAAGELFQAEQLGKERCFQLSANGLHICAPLEGKGDHFWDPEAAEGWCYRECIGRPDHAILIGGGHVSLALSAVLRPLGFRITVLDDRKNLPTMTDNSFAHESRVVDYGKIIPEIPEGERNYICIMTHGHRSDRRVLQQLAGGLYRYLGMLGSRAKVAQVFKQLDARGISPATLRKVHAPIGLPIQSNTPEEIAISIAAEMIQVRHSRLQG